ncbi:Receptor-type tyrosine-protein phosphatase delta, partial [Geodia barretti]
YTPSIGSTAKVSALVSSSGLDATRTAPSPTESPSPGFTSTMATTLSSSVYTTGLDATRTAPLPTESFQSGTSSDDSGTLVSVTPTPSGISTTTTPPVQLPPQVQSPKVSSAAVSITQSSTQPVSSLLSSDILTSSGDIASSTTTLLYSSMGDSRFDYTWILILLLAIIIALILFCIIVFCVCICRRRCCTKSKKMSLQGEAIEHPLSTETTMIKPPMAPIEEKTEDLDKYLLDIEGSDDSPALKENAFFDQILAEMFGDYVTRCHSSDNRDFKHQFTVMQDCGAGFSTIAGSNTSLQKLNRYANIMPYDDNRVFLVAVEGHTEYKGDYINASYIDGYNFEHKFIATQGPLPNTTVDFWRMVWQERSQSIVMVTNLVEGNRIKCHKYWPETGTLSFGPFNVTITGQQILADYTTREFSVQLAESSEPALSVTQFHFTAWPDHGVPDYATSLLAFHKKVKKHHKGGMGPIIVHCSAGVGRTGTLITIDCVLEQLQEEKVVDIAGVIIHLRTQRMKMVQSLEQYIFIHDAILEVLTCGDTQIDACNLRRVTQKMTECDTQTNLNDFEKQFEVLEKVSVKPGEIARSEALRNPTKNRSDDYLPGDAWRVALRGDLQTYIHAVFVNGYKQQRAFIIAQSPMESTARDFWKMVHDRKCGVIVMLCDLVEDEQVAKPYSGTVTLVATSALENCRRRVTSIGLRLD